ncbi:hypothetical protein [Zoogloea sp.]|uniref:hypothetical protein n=1 Tax=Zoogloea sp. TaxID=49181 RepID=UPI0035B0A08A
MTQTDKPDFEISLDDEETPPLDALDEGEDLPLLTDVVEERIEPYIGEATPIILEPVDGETALVAEAPPPPSSPSMQHELLAERLVALDTAISRHIEEWVNNELPQLVSRELDELAERLREAAAAHLRATLIPALSAEIADTLDDSQQG